MTPARPLLDEGPTLTTHGGAGGITARYDDLLAEADALLSCSARWEDLVVELHGILADPDLIASAPLDPVGGAHVAEELLAALDGPDGLSALAADVRARARVLQHAVAGYRTADEIVSRLVDSAVDEAGYVSGRTAPLWLPLVAVGAADVLLAELVTGHSPGTDLQSLLVHHPWLVRDGVAAAPSFLQGLLRLPPTEPASVPAAAALLGDLYPDGRPAVTMVARWDDDRPPTGVRSILGDVDADEHPASRVTIRRVTGPTGTGWIVELPGTNAWPGPGFSRDVYDTGTNLLAMGNVPTTYEHGVAAAIADAGIRPDQPVMLVGHSQGGMVATQTAAHLAGRYDVTHVVTAGSPIAHMDLPATVQSLSLQNDADVVPQLAGTHNPDVPNHVTVTFDQQTGTIAGNHGIATGYAAAAGAVDASTDPSILRWRAGTNPFFRGTSSTCFSYTIVRLPS